MNVSQPCGPCGIEASEDNWYPRWASRPTQLDDVPYPDKPAVG